MDAFQIAYEINPDDYAEAMVLLRRRVKASGFVRWGMPLIGLAVLLLPFISRELDGSYDKFLVGLSFIGAFFLICGVVQHLTRWTSRRFYKRSGVVGEKYTALFSPEDILIQSRNEQLRIKWAGFSVREESEQVFMFYSGILAYIFAKRYFTEEQVNSLRKFLAALPPPAVGSA
jgi:hypothetical protein